MSFKDSLNRFEIVEVERCGKETVVERVRTLEYAQRVVYKRAVAVAQRARAPKSLIYASCKGLPGWAIPDGAYTTCSGFLVRYSEAG